MLCIAHTGTQVHDLFDWETKHYDEPHNVAKVIEALEHLLTYHSEEIEDWALLEFLGKALYENEQYKDAINVIERAAAIIEHGFIDDDHGIARICVLDVYDQLGASYLAADQYNAAISAFERALPFIGEYPKREFVHASYHYWLSYGRSLFFADKAERSLEAFLEAEKAAKTVRDDRSSRRTSVLYLEIGMALAFVERYVDAKERLDAVDLSLLSKPLITRYWYSRLHVAHHTVENDRALLYYAEYDQRNDLPHNRALAAYMAAATNYSLGQWAKAMNLIALARELATQHEKVQVQLTEL